MENKVLAVVNGREITQMDLENTIKRYPRERQSYFMNEEGQKQLLEQLVSFELVYNDAKDSGLENDEEFKAQMESVKREMLTQVAVNKLLATVTVTDAEVAAYYEANKEMFMAEEAANAKHILVETLEKAEEVKKEIEAGLSFEEAANKYSSCPSKAQGGSLGSFTRGRMVPEFEAAAFALELGVVSEPVQTQFGFHLIKVEEKTEASVRPLAEVEAMIKNELLQERQSFKYMEFTNSLKAKYAVEMK